MNTPLPNDLAGYQHLGPDVWVKPDDIIVDEGKPFRFAGWSFSGHMVCLAEQYFGCRVYRKMPVAHQHDPL